MLRDDLRDFDPGPAVAYIYAPLEYAWPLHQLYLRQYGQGLKSVVFLGMNPGPFGMTQTGVPFGEIKAVRDWLKLRGPVGKPANQHPRRPVEGLDCPRTEISGLRLWGLFASRFGTPERFFTDHFVVNYCPLAFMSSTGRNITPDALPRSVRQSLQDICDRHLRHVIAILRPRVVVGVGGFAANRAREALHDLPIQIAQILHPSPACPASNRDWGGQVTEQLTAAGVWREEH